MAIRVPASWLQNYVANHGTGKITQNVPAPQPVTNPGAQAKPPAAPRVPKPKTPKAPGGGNQPPKRKKPGLVKGILGAWAREALGNTGHIGKYVSKRLGEDAMGSGGTPTNNASSGAVAGLGTPGFNGEPGVPKKRKKNSPLLTYKMFKRTKGITV